MVLKRRLIKSLWAHTLIMYNVIMKNLQRKRMKSKKCIPNFQPNSYRTSSLMWLLERGEKGINNVDTLPMLVGSQLATSLRIARKPWSNLLVEKRVDGRKMRRTWKKSHAWIRGMVEWYRGVAAQNMVESWSCICMYVYIYTDLWLRGVVVLDQRGFLIFFVGRVPMVI